MASVLEVSQVGQPPRWLFTRAQGRRVLYYVKEHTIEIISDAKIMGGSVQSHYDYKPGVLDV
jgi:hypothetical protein